MNFLELKSEIEDIYKGKTFWGFTIPYPTLTESTSSSFEIHSALKKISKSVPGEWKNNLNILPDYQAKVLMVVKKVLDELTAEEEKKYPDYYRRLNSVFRRAMRQPEVKKAFQNLILNETTSKAELTNSLTYLREDIPLVNGVDGGGGKVVEDNAIAKDASLLVKYRGDDAHNKTLEQMLSKINLDFDTLAKLENRSITKEDALRTLQDNSLDFAVNDPTVTPIIEWPNLPDKWPLRKDRKAFLRELKEGRYIMPKGLRKEENGGHFYLLPDTTSAVGKFHYIMLQLQMAREQYIHAYNEAVHVANINDQATALRALRKLALFQSKLVDKAIAQARLDSNDKLLDEIEPYKFEIIARSLLQDLENKVGPAYDALRANLNRCLSREYAPGDGQMTEEQRIGLLHKALIVSIKNNPTDRDLYELAIKYLIQIQGWKSTKQLIKDLVVAENLKVGGSSLDVGNIFSHIKSTSPDLTNIKGLQSEAVVKSLEDTNNIIHLKAYAKNLKAKITNLKINATKKREFSQQATNIINHLPTLERKNVAGVVQPNQIDLIVREEDMAVNKVKNSLLILEKKLNKNANEKSILSLRLDYGFFNGVKVKEFSQHQHLNLAKSLVSSPNLKAVARESLYARNNFKLSDEFIENLESNYLNFFHLGPLNHKSEANSLKDDLDQLNGLSKVGDLASIAEPAQQRIKKALVSRGLDLTDPEKVISKKIINDAMIYLIINEANRVVQANPAKSIRHGLHKGSAYLNDVLIPTLDNYQKFMSPEAKAEYFAFQQKMQLMSYKEGLGRFGKPGRGKQEWADRIIKDINEIQIQMNLPSDFAVLRRDHIEALASIDALRGLPADDNKIKIENAFKLFGLKEDGTNFIEIKNKITAFALEKLDGYDALSQLQSVFEKHIGNLKLHERRLPGGHGLYDVLTGFLQEQAKQGVIDEQRVGSAMARAEEARSNNKKVLNVEYDRLNVQDGFRRK